VNAAKRFAVAVAAGAVVAALSTTAASAAPQPTSGPCLSQANAPFCGTQQSEGSQNFQSLPLLIDVNQSGQVQARVNPSGFTGFNYGDKKFLWTHNSNHDALAQYDPAGSPADERVAGEYLTDVTTGPNSGTVALASAPNPGAAQEWDFVCGDSCGPVYTGAWQNVATGRIMEVTGNGGRVLTVPFPSGDFSPAEQFTFVLNTVPSPFRP
jgi:hypothetical protein